MIPTAVIVTRGDVDLEPALSGIPKAWPVVIWDNSKRENLKVFGHFAALDEVESDYVYMQDDDAICPAQALYDLWRPEYDDDRIFLNEAAGETPWISWGAIFHKDLPKEPLQRYIDAYGFNDDVLLWCDMIFSTLTPWANVDLKDRVTHLAHASAPNRMWMRPDHYSEQARVRDLALKLK